MQADARAAEATRQEIKAAEAARAAQQLASQASEEAVRSLWAAQRVRDEAQAATNEAVAAAAQADIAVSAANAARMSAAGIAEPANTAIAMVSPFTGDDIDADFVELVVAQAQVIGAEQAAAAKRRAEEAIVAANAAAEAARVANEQVKPAFEQAAKAAESAAQAAQSAAEAKQAAAQAAVDGKAARAAAASAARADEQARADAIAARNAANEAASDAAIAGKAAAAAQSEADAANSAASRAESDAAAARGAAAAAERDAAAAEASAESAQKHADSAAIAADKALGYAVEAQKAFERAEAADREREQRERAEDIAGGGGLTPEEERDLLASMTPAEQERYRAAKEQADQGILDFIKANAGDLVLSLLGLDNIKGCFMDGNITACLWALADFIPWSKALSLTADLLKFAPKIARFVKGLTNARQEVDELTDLAKARKKANEPPCTGLAAPRNGLRAKAAAATTGESCPIVATKTLPSRSAAFRDAKRDLKIPMSKVPDKVERVPMTDKFGNPVLDANKQRVMTREYHFTRDDGSKVVIQDHSAGHQFGEGGVGDQGRHLNVRPGDNTRTGKVEGTAQHYEW
ncbi:HNH/endonuclease VII fold putative polymorphic toxin [Paractinoplanes brasiliensis]|uniref:HNH/endonuclease VII toxin of polymorphic toxin system component n=1 Tax=Paractinoplanes brasiliensis TaxID=52695 RepID=A0A4R6JZ98_9ACTN|nr:HNH/endonuclease VII fold putative polymorphic toxin [Actinoplanes brasiliensis]TDO40596.1 HNH/endonuclease VII toxin of polymorphic toxin system component [Actinoplanes brasiliensis]GID25665.1 hypothetical protein Abr02nite_06480 [Actinoplanes brasiliensis]